MRNELMLECTRRRRKYAMCGRMQFILIVRQKRNEPLILRHTYILHMWNEALWLHHGAQNGSQNGNSCIPQNVTRILIELLFYSPIAVNTLCVLLFYILTLRRWLVSDSLLTHNSSHLNAWYSNGMCIVAAFWIDLQYN